MPSFLPPEAVHFELRDGVPVVVLAVEPPPGLTPGEWSVLNRLTLVVVDGPGDAGYLLPRYGADGDAAPAGWDDAVERLAGSHVQFGLDRDAPALFAPTLA